MKPRPSPESAPQYGVLAMKPAVAYPRAPRNSATVGAAASSGVRQPTDNSWGHRPVNMLACEARVQEEAGWRGVEPAAAPGQLVDRGAGRARVAVEIEVIGGDGVHHDQEDVRGIGRDRPPQFAPLLDPVGHPGCGREGRQRQDEDRQSCRATTRRKAAPCRSRTGTRRADRPRATTSQAMP